MRVLVTGSAGFIGRRLNLEHHQVMRVDLRDGVDILDGDTADVIQAFDPHIVYHLAAHHFIPWTETHQMETDRTNVMGTGMVLGACGKSLRAFVLASSAAVYGFGSEPFMEGDKLRGDSIYARSKMAAESLLRHYAELHPSAKCIAARLFNVVGPGDETPHVLPSIIRAVSDTGQVTLGNLWPKRDYVHVDDVAEALAFFVDNAPRGFSTYNVGTGLGTTVADLAIAVGRVMGRNLSVGHAKDERREEDGDLVADVGKTSDLGWYATRTIEEAIADILAEEGVHVAQ